jgi:hypothetical protein
MEFSIVRTNEISSANWPQRDGAAVVASPLGVRPGPPVDRLSLWERLMRLASGSGDYSSSDVSRQPHSDTLNSEAPLMEQLGRALAEAVVAAGGSGRDGDGRESGRMFAWASKVPIVGAIFSVLQASVDRLVSYLAIKPRGGDAVVVSNYEQDSSGSVAIVASACEEALRGRFQPAESIYAVAEQLSEKLMEAVARASQDMGSANASESQRKEEHQAAMRRRQEEELQKALAKIMQIDASTEAKNEVAMELIRQLSAFPFMPVIEDILARVAEAEAQAMQALGRRKQLDREGGISILQARPAAVSHASEPAQLILAA